MADTIVTQEQMTLRRRARRRLVGAIAIALAAVLLLPMLFDPEPKPLGPEVDIRIPAKDSAFEPAPTPAIESPAAVEPATQQAEPTQPVPTPSIGKTAGDAALDAPTAARTSVKPISEKSAPEKKSVEKKPEPATPLAKPATSQTSTPILPKSKQDSAFTTRGYFLQLGAFSSAINAGQLQEKAQAAGFKAVTNDANGQFRVRVGPITDHAKALEIQAKLKAKGFSPVLIGS